ncbi:MAG: CHASE2 domain-containing protein [Nitrospirales bacterium]|nr:CHASE2 domain-containing protein [Nitrospirales bacterium]
MAKRGKENRKVREVFRATLILGVPLSLLLSVLVFFHAFDGIELKLLNLGFREREPIVRKQDIITIDIDDAAVSRVGRWPWSWEVHAALLDLLSLHRARSVAFVDMDFSKELPVSFPPDAAEGLRRKMENALSGKAGPAALSLAPDSAGSFPRSVRRNGSTCFTVGFRIPEEQGDRQRTLQRAEAAAALHTGQKRDSLRLLTEAVSLSGEAGDFPLATDILPLTPDLMRGSRCYGFNTIVLDRDGVVRTYPLLASYRGNLYPSLGLEMARRLMGATEIKVKKGGYVELKSPRERVRIPINHRGEMYINWTGEYKESFVHLPFPLVATFIGYQKAKEELKKHPLATMQDPSALNGILAEALRQSRLFTEDESSSIGTMVFLSALLEYYVVQGNYSLEETLSALGLDPKEEVWLTVGRQIAFNNYVVQRYREGGKPSFVDALRGTGFTPGKDQEAHYRDAYERTVFYLENEKIDAVRPLYYGPPLTLTQGKREIPVTPLFFKDKVVFYGLTATGLSAQNATPFSNLQTMLDLVPTVLNTIATGNFIEEWQYPLSYAYLFAILFSVLLLPPLQGFLLSGLAAGSHIGLGWLAFSKGGTLLPVAPPVFAVLSAYLSAVAYRYFQERKERKKVRAMFSTMVSPEVLRMMEESPEKFRLAGEKTEATLFSSDVSGFTTISEGVTARELATILNIYLTPMSNIIMSYGGYVDKYEGDAIKADFGVPLPDGDHPWKACFSALLQQEELKVIQRMILLKYGVKITARMGINTGIVLAGNMGSERRMQYTVMGEAVTLAEELEPANKLFGTWIALGPVTFGRTGEHIEVRYLNRLARGAEAEAVPVYELLGWKREKFLEYWRGRPVPEPALESLKRMLPEKVIAYHEFYLGKGLPESILANDFRGLFGELSGKALECMRIGNRKGVLFVREEKELLKQRIGRYERLQADAPEALVRGREESKRKRDGEGEAWGRVLLGWREELKECSLHLHQARAGMPREEFDACLNTVDILEKSLECLYKRITVARPDDRIGMEMALHLKGLIAGEIAPAPAESLSGLEEKSSTLESEINGRLARFAAELRGRAEEYHTMMADFCTVSEDKRRVVGLFRGGQEHYFRREWEEAEERFREALVLDPEDGPSQQFIRKVRELRENPPGEGWTGEWEE